MHSRGSSRVAGHAFRAVAVAVATAVCASGAFAQAPYLLANAVAPGALVRVQAEGREQIEGETSRVSSDSLWVAVRHGFRSQDESIPISAIRHLDVAHNNYPLSVAVGAAVGAIAGAVFYSSAPPDKRGAVFAASMAGGALSGLLVPIKQWVAWNPPLRQ